MRFHVAAHVGITDGRTHRVFETLRGAGLSVRDVRIVDVYIVEGIPGFHEADAADFFCDRVSQELVDMESDLPELPWSLLIEVASRPGVANPVASTVRDALSQRLGELPSTAVIQTARQYLLDGALPDGDAAAALFHNPLIELATSISREKWRAGDRPPAAYPVVGGGAVPPVLPIELGLASDEELLRVSSERLLALDLREMRAIRDYYADAEVASRRLASGLDTAATDVELEMIAQTWSEHCKHKIFAARITYTEPGGERSGRPETIDGLFDTYIRATTRRVAGDSFVKSVFHDNAGVVLFDEQTLVCFKAETHNSPSALDPYGGAITGIVGVNRDILGTGKGAKPIFNTDVLCFGAPDTPADELPEGLLHPRRVLGGVHRGIVDGGNQSGIPVAAGAFLFDESYVGKPLVFCGTGGLLPATVGGEAAWVKHINPGDLAVMVGGRIGKDGIHGATFSSLGLDESSPTSAVQIGDPITQRRMTDFLIEARDRELYRGITDNGAGGLSSSLGEMASEPGGLEIDLDAAPLKYSGLAAWEILVSESQERMSLAVSPDTLEALLELAGRRGVEATVVGTFTDDGTITIRHGGRIAGRLDLDFLHDGLPRMELEAHWPGRPATESADADPIPGPSLRETLLALLADPNIASKESLVRQYDHEVQGGSIVKPFCGAQADGPSDGAVLKPRYDSWRGISVTHGICPRYGDVDTYHMAVAAVDEAVRAHVAVGGDPRRMAALDNFCWPDPVLSESTPDGRFKLAQLVRACRGLADACTAYSLPLVSGKDSMKNDSYLGGRKVSIRPTLLVSLMGIVPDVRRALTSSFKRQGDRIVLLGSAIPALGGSAWQRCCGGNGASDPWLAEAAARCPQSDLPRNVELYDAVHAAVSDGLLASLHDVADGGIAIAITECAIGGRLGASIALPADIAPATFAPLAGGAPPATSALLSLFGERTGTFVATCTQHDLRSLLQRIPDAREIGVVTGRGEAGEGTAGDEGATPREPVVEIACSGLLLRWQMGELLCAWNALPRLLRPGTDEVMTSHAPAGPPEHLHDTGSGARAAVSGNSAARTGDTPVPVEVVIVTGHGINAELELAEAFRRAGAAVTPVHVNELTANPGILQSAGVLAFPGGFSYGDHAGSGLMLAHKLRELKPQIEAFRESGRLILGICNGFQVLCKLGILPDLSGDWRQDASLVHNESGLFEDSWVRLESDPDCSSPWLAGITSFDAPIRHGEGRFVVASESTLDRLRHNNLVALRYLQRNPNGSVDSIAGVVDRTGRVLGMMPHPEAFLVLENHPLWREAGGDRHAIDESLRQARRFFVNAVDYAATIGARTSSV